jgi:hypothetical protein
MPLPVSAVMPTISSAPSTPANAGAKMCATPLIRFEIILHIPEAHAEVAYRFSSDTVSRRIANGEWAPVLDRVKTSAFIDDRRKNTTAWVWEVELQTYRKSLTRTRPLFTFIAAAPNNLAP